MPPSLSLIYLVYNEQEALTAVCEEALDHARASLGEFEVILVDDGSRDRSPEIAAQFAAAHSEVRVVTHERNRGMGAAMATGIGAARCEYLVFLSADGQAPVAAIDAMLPLLDSADIVVTTYSNGRGSLTREILSGGLRLLMRYAAGIRFRLEGLYLFPTAVAAELAATVEAETFFFSFELIDRASARGLTIAETQMAYRPREAGKTKIANLRRVLRVGREVVAYARRKRR